MSKFKNSGVARRVAGFGSVAMLFVVTGVASATALNTTGPGGGVLNLGNLSVQVTSACINFYNGASPDTCGTTGDTFSVNAPIDGSLFTLNSTGAIKDIPMSSGGVVPAFVQTTGTGAVPNVSFDLTGLVTPASVPCPPTTTPGVCDLPGSPFVFTVNDSTHITVSLTVNLCGYITGSSSGTNCSAGTLYTGLFTSQFTGVSLATLITEAGAPGGITDSTSATFSPVSGVPEPMTLSMMGVGLLGLGLISRRRKQS